MSSEEYAKKVHLAAQTATSFGDLLHLRKCSTDSIKNDVVNHPSHYTQGDIECIDAIEAALGAEGFKAYCKGACIKYLWRTEHKNGLEDLQKCQWYLNKLLEKLISAKLEKTFF
jgi:hypothetical protein